MAVFPPHLGQVLNGLTCPGGKKHFGQGILAIRCYWCRVQALHDWEEELKKRPPPVKKEKK